MKSTFIAFDCALSKVTRLAAILAGLCILLTAFIVVYEIIMRGLFNSPTEWVLEISTYLIIVAGFLGLAVTFRDGAHIEVDFLTSRLPEKTALVTRFAVTAIAIVLFTIFVTESTDMVMMSYKFQKLSPSILRFPLYIPQLSMVVGFALLLLELIRRCCLDAYCLATGQHLIDETADKKGAH